MSISDPDWQSPVLGQVPRPSEPFTIENFEEAIDSFGSKISTLVGYYIRDPGAPLSSLYRPTFAGPKPFLQYPLNLDSAEENHWIRFDIFELIGKTLLDEDAEHTSAAARRPIVKPAPGERGSLALTSNEKEEYLHRILGQSTAERTPGRVSDEILGLFGLPTSLNEAVDQYNSAASARGVGIGPSGDRTRGQGSIMLYAPHTRQDTFRLAWKQENVGMSGAIFEAMGGSPIGIAKNATGADAFSNNESLQAMLAQKGDLLNAVASKFMGAFVGNAENFQRIALRSRGRAWNPYLEQFFENVEVRTFTFDFRLAPKSSQEARVIKDIVQLFKYSAAPAIADGPGGVFFTYPNIFHISLFNEDQTHRISKCALTSVATNHSAAGVNSTFHDNYPVETSLSLTFTELDILDKSMIDKGY